MPRGHAMLWNAIRRLWLPFRYRFIPPGSRRDRLYRRVRRRASRFRDLSRRAGLFVDSIGQARLVRSEYEQFQRDFEPTALELSRQRAEVWADGPVFSIVTAVFNPPRRILQQTARSVRDQTYARWRWHVADASPGSDLWEQLQQRARLDPRIEPIRLTENRGIAANLNEGLRAATGDFVVMLDHDDTLATSALYEFARAIRARPDADFLYSDCDKLDDRGRRCEPFFKPDWSPELLLCANYLEHLAVFRRSLLDRAGFLDSTIDPACDWDLYLRIARLTQAFVHVPKVLHHWRKTAQSTAQAIDNKPGVRPAQREAVLRHLRWRGVSNPRVEFDARHPVHSHHPRVQWDVGSAPRISIVIPTLDHVNLLSVCLDGVLNRTTYTNIEVILVDTGSRDLETFELYRALANRPDVRLVEYTGPFNFARACNLGARHATGDLILLLNNDIEFLHPEWLSRMAQWFDIPGVGVVGPKMLYPNGRMHHGGVVVGIGRCGGS